MPTQHVRAGKQREVINRMIVTLLSEVSREYLNEPRLAAVVDDVLLLVAVHMGQVQGRPMTAAKVAQFIGMPRPSAVRRLNALRAVGLVEVTGKAKVLGLPSAKIHTKKILRVTQEMAELVQHTSRELSKLDT